LSPTDGNGYLGLNGKPDVASRNAYEKLGRALIEFHIQKKYA